MRIRAVLLAIGVIAGAAVLLYLIYRLPNLLAEDRFRELGPKDRLDATAALRTQFAALIGTPIALVALLYTARKFLLDRDKQDIDRFSTAVAHLAADDPVTRSGGIFALQRLMEDAPRERERGRRLLARYLQQRTANGEFTSAPGDLVDAVAVLRSQLTSRHRTLGLDLTAVRLPAADFGDARLPGALLSRADLTGARLRGGDLREADLSAANLTGADLRDCDLTGASLRGARLNDAQLSGARLAGADVTGAVFTGADLPAAARRGLAAGEAIGLGSSPADTQTPAAALPDA
ncbi:pentapeptide repeat-containing protein [Nocardia sp. FBN12]|uniref:pentapeptide repeat-containing protein n=1 Tax=Nocardia sp. FBN12 TaxID=3419766 RepID=UPI003D020B9D